MARAGDREAVLEAEVAAIERALDLGGGAGRPEAAARLDGLRHRFREAPGAFPPALVERLRRCSSSLRGPVRLAGASPAEARRLLRDLFGHPDFRPGQEAIVGAALAGRDCLGVMPTGAGKSLTYQLPARLLGGTTLVVSPLVALMKDQVDAMARAGLRATFLNSTLGPEERRARVASLRRGEVELLYAAPEGLEASVGGALSGLGLSLIAVDEAHCISHWGHDFRPAYRNLAGLKDRFGAPVLALTATATPAVVKDIAAQLGMADPLVVTGSFLRRNLRLHAVRKGGDRPPAREAVLRLVRARRGQGGIVYALGRRTVEGTAAFLARHGVRAAPYHAGLEADERARVQDAFRAGALDVVVATVAFGMGIDKPDIRFVLHQDLPRSIEAYAQEVGRAGRDGREADCVLLYSWADVVAWDRMAPDDPALAAVQRRQVRAMYRFAEGEGCRHERLCGWFGERIEPCGDACDACTGADPLEAAPAAPLRRGGRAERGRSSRARPAPRRERARTGLGRGARRSGGDAGPGWEAGQDAWDGADGAEVGDDGPAPEAAEADDGVLLAALKAWRTGEARARGVPAYVVFPDATLAAVAAARPRTAADLGEVRGIGPRKLEAHGAALLDLVRRAR